MSDYFERIEVHLLDAVERHARHRSGLRGPHQSSSRARFNARFRRPRWLPSVGNVTLALVAMSSLVIGGAALVLIGRHAASPSDSPGRPAGVRPLVAELAVLRRPQTGEDELHIKFVPYITILPASTRLAAILPDGGKLYLYIGRADPQKAPPALRARLLRKEHLHGNAYGLGSIWVSPDGHWSAPYPGVTAAAVARITGSWFSDRNGGRATFTGIVPDGVARVRWSFGRHDRPPLNVGITVHNNIATANVAIPFHDSPDQVIWYAADGRVIRSTTNIPAP